MRWALGVVESRYGRPAARIVHRGGATTRINGRRAPDDRQLVAAA
jgi:hypothetical protein